MKKNNKAFSNLDYLANLRKNNIYGVNYYDNLSNEFAEEESDFNQEYYKHNEENCKKTKDKEKCGCNNQKKSQKKKSGK